MIILARPDLGLTQSDVAELHLLAWAFQVEGGLDALPPGDITVVGETPEGWSFEAS
jgi:hypothetical protein